MNIKYKFSALAIGFAIILLPNFAIGATNLIPNSDFEVASTTNPSLPQSWSPGRWGTNTATFSYSVSSGNGSKAVSINISSYTSGDAKWAFKPVSIAGGHTYEYSDEYISDTSTYITLEYTLSDGTKSYPDIAQPAPTSSWKKESVRFTAPANATSVSVFHLINKTGSLSIDNATLVEVAPSQPPAPDSTNWISNPSLEFDAGNNMPVNWYKGSWGSNTATFSYPTPGFDGINAAKVTLTNYISGDAKWYFKEVPVKAGTNYQFTDNYKSTSNVFVTAQLRKSDGTISFLDIGKQGPSSSWTEFKYVFTVPQNVVSLTIFHLIKSNGSLEIDNYKLIETNLPPTDPSKFDQGYVSINFDDGWLSAYQNAFPQLTNYGFVSDQFIVTGRMSGSFPGYVTQSEILDMQSNGGVIGAHTIDHVDLTSVSQAEADRQISQSRQDLFSIGITPVNIFSYPFGGYNSTVQQLVKNAGYIAARSSDGGYNDKFTNKFALKRQPMLNTTTLADVQNYIDTAIRNKTWVILLFHEINNSGDTYAVTPQLFAQILDYLNQKGIKPISIQQGVNMIN